MDYPAPISDYLIGRLYPVYFLIDDQGIILAWGGALNHYPIPTPVKGMRVNDLLFFVEGLLPLSDNQLVLECVEWQDGIVVDVHLFRDAHQLWLLLTDAGQKAQDQRRGQQKVNELLLLRDAHTRNLGQIWSRESTPRQSGIAARCGAQRRTLSILFTHIRRFSSFCEHGPPSDVFETLNTYLTAMIEPVLDYAGIAHTIVGDAVMAIFGLLPSDCPAPELAVAAAKAIIDKTLSEGQLRRQAGKSPLAVGVGIATGPVVVGAIGSKDRKMLSVTGHSVNLAERLERQAAGEEILIDRVTKKALQTDRLAFTARRLTRQGVDRPITAYGWTMAHED